MKGWTGPKRTAERKGNGIMEWAGRQLGPDRRCIQGFVRGQAQSTGIWEKRGSHCVPTPHRQTSVYLCLPSVYPGRHMSTTVDSLQPPQSTSVSLFTLTPSTHARLIWAHLDLSIRSTFLQESTFATLVYGSLQVPLKADLSARLCLPRSTSVSDLGSWTDPLSTGGWNARRGGVEGDKRKHDMLDGDEQGMGPGVRHEDGKVNSVVCPSPSPDPSWPSSFKFKICTSESFGWLESEEPHTPCPPMFPGGRKHAKTGELTGVCTWQYSWNRSGLAEQHVTYSTAAWLIRPSIFRPGSVDVPLIIRTEILCGHLGDRLRSYAGITRVTPRKTTVASQFGGLEEHALGAAFLRTESYLNTEHV
ncbi:hypothetical protein DFH07DRAFT_781599 [Mycena maculata]|uniref:Uncharacterized protein n=1 Tax=Mycena maculata TaxID=230809 RepID=A0AAD7MST8_9AGAR|nr:hypothetical protein DFH07DRAFT_781599 [Mycena maculata]